MNKRRYKNAVAGLEPELEALSRREGARPEGGDDQAAMAGWVALCLSAFGEASEELHVNEDDEMAGAADAREAMLGAARIALDALEEVCAADRGDTLSFVQAAAEGQALAAQVASSGVGRAGRASARLGTAGERGSGPLELLA
jgi:hypothetical protein